LLVVPALANECRDNFGDHNFTIRACNLIISCPLGLMPEVIRALQIHAQALIISDKTNLAITNYTSALVRLPKGQLKG
tara:strand:+ start:133 stop:366 length:234 start_codon:yes stop_codon:yes gene_type:complete